MSHGLYSCNLCGKAFDAVCHLETHVRSHTGERPYCCEYCDKSFTVMSNLKRHIKTIHAKERAFQCELCKKTFSQSNNLKRHLKTHPEAQDVFSMIDDDRSRAYSDPKLESTEQIIYVFSDDRNRSSSDPKTESTEQSIDVCDLDSLCSAEDVDRHLDTDFKWCNVELEFEHSAVCVTDSADPCDTGLKLQNMDFLATESFPKLKRSGSLSFGADYSNKSLLDANSQSLPSMMQERSTPDILYLSRNNSDKDINRFNTDAPSGMLGDYLG